MQSTETTDQVLADTSQLMAEIDANQAARDRELPKVRQHPNHHYMSPVERDALGEARTLGRQMGVLYGKNGESGELDIARLMAAARVLERSEVAQRPLVTEGSITDNNHQAA